MLALHYAANVGREGAYQALLDVAQERRETFREEDKEGWTDLHHAAYDGQETVCRSILAAALTAEERKAKLLAKSIEGKTALHIAAVYGWPDGACCRALLEMTRTAQELREVRRAQDKNGMTALHLAACHGREASCQSLLEAAQTAEERREAFTQRDNKGCTPIKFALDKPAVALIMMESSGALVEECRGLLMARDEAGLTPLHLAARSGKQASCRLLLEMAQMRAIDPSITPMRLIAARTKTGCTPIHLATTEGHELLLKELLAAAPSSERNTLLAVPNSGGKTAMHIAAEKGHTAAARVLLEVAVGLGKGRAIFGVMDVVGRTPVLNAKNSAIARELLAMQPSRAGCLVAQLASSLANLRVNALQEFALEVFLFGLGFSAGPGPAILGCVLMWIGAKMDMALAAWLWVHTFAWLCLGVSAWRVSSHGQQQVVFSLLPLWTSPMLADVCGRRCFAASLAAEIHHGDLEWRWGVTELQLDEALRTQFLYFPGWRRLFRLLVRATFFSGFSILGGLALAVHCVYGVVGQIDFEVFIRAWPVAVCCIPFLLLFVLLLSLAVPLVMALLFMTLSALGALTGMLLAVVSPLMGLAILAMMLLRVCRQSPQAGRSHEQELMISAVGRRWE